MMLIMLVFGFMLILIIAVWIIAVTARWAVPKDLRPECPEYEEKWARYGSSASEQDQTGSTDEFFN